MEVGLPYRYHCQFMPDHSYLLVKFQNNLFTHFSGPHPWPKLAPVWLLRLVPVWLLRPLSHIPPIPGRIILIQKLLSLSCLYEIIKKD